MQRHEQYACEKYRSELFQIEQVNGYPTYDMENVKEEVDVSEDFQQVMEILEVGEPK